MKNQPKNPTSFRFGILFMAAASLLQLTSCSEDEQSAVHPLVGAWYLSAFNKTECTEPADNEFYTLPCTPTFCFELLVSADQTYQIKTTIPDEAVTIITGTYKIQGSNLEICEDNLYCNNGEFEILDGNTVFTLTEVDGATGCISVSTFTRK